jgi:Cu/Ag efflux protein CusF
MVSISLLFCELIKTSQVRPRILLYKFNQEDETLTEQFYWSIEGGCRRKEAEPNFSSLEVIKWLHSNFTLTTEIVKSQVNHALLVVAKNGYLEVLRWLHFNFSYTLEDVRSRGYQVLHQASTNNARFEILKWLHFTFNLTETDIKSNRNFVLCTTARSGNLEAIKWLHSTFKFTDQDVKDNDNFVLKTTAKHGHLKALKWFNSTFNFTVEDVRTDNSYGLRMAIKYGHLKVLRWLHSTFTLSEKDINRDNYQLLRLAIQKEAHTNRSKLGSTGLEVLKWVNSAFNSMREMACIIILRATAFEYGQLEIYRWLHSLKSD